MKALPEYATAFTQAVVPSTNGLEPVEIRLVGYGETIFTPQLCATDAGTTTWLGTVSGQEAFKLPAGTTVILRGNELRALVGEGWEGDRPMACFNGTRLGMSLR